MQPSDETRIVENIAFLSAAISVSAVARSVAVADGTNFARLGLKCSLFMIYSEDNNRFRREERKREAERTEERLENSMQVPVVTQIKPDAKKRIDPTPKGEAVSQQQLEQDVTKTNPSIESMESRG